jgi:hypothetical protein
MQLVLFPHSLALQTSCITGYNKKAVEHRNLIRGEIMAKRRVEREPVVQPLDQSIKLIPLTKGQVATVDVADYEWLMQWPWNAYWHPRTKSYYARQAHGKLMHRLILGLTDPAIKCDHQDGDTLNNRRYNLRVATDQQNAQNRKTRSDNKCGHVGIWWRKDVQMWQASIFDNGKPRHLGYFRNFDDAFFARSMAEIEVFGQFAPILRH